MFTKAFIAFVGMAVSSLSQAQESLHQAVIVNEEVPVTLVDSRPPEQKNGKLLSTNIWKCSYAIRRIGDSETTPPRLERLNGVLSESFPEMRGRTVLVKNYTMHFNASAAARKGFSRSYSGAIAGGINAPVSGCAAEDLQGGYTPGEIQLKNNPVITVIDLSVNGREFHFRTLSDTDSRFINKPEVARRNFNNAATQAMTEFVPALREFLSGTSL